MTERIQSRMRILILGGTGFIGPHVVAALAGHELLLFHRGYASSPLPYVSHIQGDRANLRLFRPVFADFKPDVVVDMNARNGDDAADVLAAIDGLSPRTIMVSSHSVYRTFGVILRLDQAPIDNRPQTEASPIRESRFPYRRAVRRASDDPRQWMDDYDKIPAEHVFLDSGLPCNIVRLPLVYGPDDPDHRVGIIVDRLANGRPISFAEPMASWRNSRAHVVNAAAAIAIVALRGHPGQIYNVAEPGDFAEAEWVDRISAAIGRSPRVSSIAQSGSDRPLIGDFPVKANFAQHLRADSRRIRQELGYREIIDPEAALRATVHSRLTKNASR